MKKNPTLFLLAFMAFALNLHAQDGQNDVRFIMETPLSCATVADFTIQVRATSPATEFFMSEQNYRFSFNRATLANPRITEELTISNFINPVPMPRNFGFALFSPHNLVGSLDTVVSYNIELAGGDGYYVSADDWVDVGTVQFDVLDQNGCFDLIWHSQAVFPSTFIGEIFTENGTDARSNTDENFFGNQSNCFTCLPVELIYFTGEERDCKNHLTWETATETDSDFFVIERSFNATNFSEIGRVNAAGTSLENQSYNFTDQWAGAEMYYRLKQVDIDGSFVYFDLIKIISECHADDTGTFIDVFPNPIVGEAQAFVKLFVDTHETVFIDVVDVKGALVSVTPVSIFNGPNLLNFPTDKLAAGTYFIRVRGGGWFSNASKFVKLDK